MLRPGSLFDREREWAALAQFADGSRAGLAIVRGRRRHGKSALLTALSEATGGFYHQAIRGVPADQRRDLARAWAAANGGPEPAFSTWEDAVAALLGTKDTGLVVIDELPYWTNSAPELESILQRALDRARRSGGARLVACGSAQAIMSRLLQGDAPLRGRAQLELDVRPFGFREAARFARLEPDVALPVHAVIGGVPGYAVDLLDNTFPTSANDVQRWLVEVVAAPTRPLVHEARALVEAEPGLREPALYLSVLGALASGATRTGEVAALLGRNSDSLAHALRTIEGHGLVRRQDDVLRRGRPIWQVADPLLRFYAALLRTRWSLVERGDRRRLSSQIAEPWRAQVLGPHFEQLARDWAAEHAADDTLGGEPAVIGRGTVDDPATRTRHEIDLVAIDGQGSVVALGEAKLRRLGPDDAARLVRLRQILSDAGRGRRGARLLLISAEGFTRGASEEPGVELVDLERLYAGA